MRKTVSQLILSSMRKFKHKTFNNTDKIHKKNYIEKFLKFTPTF